VGQSGWQIPFNFIALVPLLETFFLLDLKQQFSFATKHSFAILTNPSGLSFERTSVT